MRTLHGPGSSCPGYSQAGFSLGYVLATRRAPRRARRSGIEKEEASWILVDDCRFWLDWPWPFQRAYTGRRLCAGAAESPPERPVWRWLRPGSLNQRGAEVSARFGKWAFLPSLDGGDKRGPRATRPFLRGAGCRPNGARPNSTDLRPPFLFLFSFLFSSSFMWREHAPRGACPRHAWRNKGRPPKPSQDSPFLQSHDSLVGRLRNSLRSRPSRLLGS